MTDEQILDFLTDNLDYFITNDLVITILRTIGWVLVKGVNAILDACKTLYDHTFGLVDITKWTGIESFISEYDVLIKAIVVLSLVVLGYMFLFGKDKKHDLLISVMIFAVVFTSSSYLFSTFNSFVVMFKEGMVSSSGNADGYDLVRQNLYDLRYIDSEIGLANMTSSGEIPRYDSLNESDVQMIDICETLSNEEEGLTEEAKDILGKELIYVHEASVLEDVYNGVAWTDFGNTYYYRYQFHFGTFFLSALATIFVLIGLSYKNTRIVYELVASRTLVTLFASDLSNKKKAVRLLEAIRDGYYALCFTAITLRLFFLFNEYLTSQTTISGLERGIILLFIAFCTVDGANIMEKITGIDAGLSSMAGKMLAGMHMIKGATQSVQQHRQMHMLKNQTKAMEKMAGGTDTTKSEPMEKGMKDENSARTGEFRKGQEEPFPNENPSPSTKEAVPKDSESPLKEKFGDKPEAPITPPVEKEFGGEMRGKDKTDQKFKEMDQELGEKPGEYAPKETTSTPRDRFEHRDSSPGIFERWRKKSDKKDNHDKKE